MSCLDTAITLMIRWPPSSLTRTLADFRSRCHTWLACKYLRTCSICHKRSCTSSDASWPLQGVAHGLLTSHVTACVSVVQGSAVQCNPASTAHTRAWKPCALKVQSSGWAATWQHVRISYTCNHSSKLMCAFSQTRRSVSCECGSRTGNFSGGKSMHGPGQVALDDLSHVMHCSTSATIQ